MPPEIKEIKRVKIRSVIRVTFLFHVIVGLFIGLLLVVAWGVIGIFEMYEIIPDFLGDVGKPTTFSILKLFSLVALTLGILGVIIWSLLTLLYNLIAGFTRGIRVEAITHGIEKGDERSDD
jgi:hypothetical protein